MRAAATFGFGRVHGLGMLAWHRSEVSGKMLGNPSVSETLTSYMLSLRCRKTLKGEISLSAHAVTSVSLVMFIVPMCNLCALISQLYNYNNQPVFQEPQAYKPSARNVPKEPDGWGGTRSRTECNLGYCLFFCGLLWVDELLKIQVHDIELETNPETGLVITLTLHLPFCKTSQFGEIKPFVFHVMPDQYAHLCVVRAYLRWILVSGITEGYVFRKMCANDRIAEENEPMTSEQFLEMFRNNLVDVGVDPLPYG
ncbi:hypothetical protein BDP27DRAFT_1280690, partial [Rhodocollybia butyracea]